MKVPVKPLEDAVLRLFVVTDPSGLIGHHVDAEAAQAEAEYHAGTVWAVLVSVDAAEEAELIATWEAKP